MNKKRSESRRALLRRILSDDGASSQAEVGTLLARHGHAVSQTTISRDLDTIGAIKVHSPGTGERYIMAANRSRQSTETPSSGQVHILREFVLGAAQSGNLVVIQTSPGGASPVAAALDGAALPWLLGTLAGDDTVLAITRSPTGGRSAVQTINEILEN